MKHPLHPLAFYRWQLGLCVGCVLLPLMFYLMRFGCGAALCEWCVAGLVAAVGSFLATRCVVVPALPASRQHPCAPWHAPAARIVTLLAVWLPPALSALALWGIVVLAQPLPTVGWAMVVLMLNLGAALEAVTRLASE